MAEEDPGAIDEQPQVEPAPAETEATGETTTESVEAPEEQAAETEDDTDSLGDVPPEGTPERANYDRWQAKLTQQSQELAQQRREIGELAALRQLSDDDPKMAATIMEAMAQRLRGADTATPEPAAGEPTELGGIPLDDMTDNERALAQEVIRLRGEVQGVSYQSTAAALEQTMEEITSTYPDLSQSEVADVACAMRDEVLRNPRSPKLLRWAAQLRHSEGQRKQSQQASLAHYADGAQASRQYAAGGNLGYRGREARRHGTLVNEAGPPTRTAKGVAANGCNRKCRCGDYRDDQPLRHHRLGR